MAGRKWIFIRGLVRGHGHWADFEDHFKKKFPQDTIEHMDLPGNGKNCHEVSPLRIGDYVKFLEKHSRFFAEASKKEKPNLLGHSLGAMVAVEWAQRHPEKFSKLYLINTSAANLASPIQRMRWQILPQALRALVSPTVEKQEEIVLNIICNNHKRVQEVLPVMSRFSKENPVQKFNLARQLIAASQVRFPEQAPIPTVLVGSTHDQLVDVRSTLNLAKKWKIEPHIHPWAGHDLAVDDPDWLIAQLAENQ